MVMRQAIASRKERDEPMGEKGGCKPEELIRGGQGLAEGQPWQPLRAPGMQPSKGPKVPLHLENWLTAKIYNINNNKEVKIVVIFKSKLKLAKGLLIYLIVIVVFYKVLNCLSLNLIIYLLKNFKQLINRQVAKIIVQLI